MSKLRNNCYVLPQPTWYRENAFGGKTVESPDQSISNLKNIYWLPFWKSKSGAGFRASVIPSTELIISPLCHIQCCLLFKAVPLTVGKQSYMLPLWGPGREPESGRQRQREASCSSLLRKGASLKTSANLAKFNRTQLDHMPFSEPTAGKSDGSLN